ncbi:toll/interleukin-1 receptor domain-containing adapter protein [Ranitomeya variabilis]|uniref:toll/interleukin-1 receptor domain-containing adapter protein n=1 Tax=Ranitomeya variabilis TaxID=490064 RepID=UPI004057CAB0
MGSRESKLKSSPRIPTSLDHGSRIRTVTSAHSMPMQPVQSTNPAPIPVWPDGSVRWQSQYDVYICHSEADVSYAMEMLSYLEQQPEKVRCFLPMRDMQAGGPIPSEMCSGLESSHCWVMLLTPQFLSDNWCKYQMHQFLAQAPCSNGRLIPVIIGLSFAQYPSVVKHMYAIKGTFNDPSVFSKVKDAIVTYLKEMINVTSDQIPAYSPRSRTPEGSPSTSNLVGNSLLESRANQEPTSARTISCPVTQEPTSDKTIRSPQTQEPTSDRTIRSPVTQEPTSDRTIRSPQTQEPTSDRMIRCPVTQEPTSDRTIKSPVTQEPTSDRTIRSPVTQEPTINRMIRCPVTQEPTSDRTIRSPVTQEPTSDMSVNGSVMTQEVISDASMSGSMTGQETTSDTSMSGSMTGQETTSDASMSGSMTGQETISDVSLMDSMMGQEPPLQDPHSDISISLASGAVLADSEFSRTATKDLSLRETRQDTSDSGVWSMSRDLVTDSSDYDTS